MDTKNYNILYEKWVPVLFNNGSFQYLNILETFQEANNIREIAASNPMDKIAVVRFLLVLLYWCNGNPDDSIKNIRKFPDEWFIKLKNNENYFNLFGDGKRFYQFYIDSKSEYKSINQLIHEIPSGTNIWHFRHVRDAENGICPSCAVLGLLRLPVFTTVGGRSKSQGINQQPPVYLIPVGSSLFETLLLSYIPVENLGKPSWEHENMSIPTTGEISFLMGLTALARQVWFEEPKVKSYCVMCGKYDNLILKTVFDATDIRTEKNNWYDPHVLYYKDRNEIKSYRTFDTIKQIFITDWLKLYLYIYDNEKHNSVRYKVVGFASSKAKYIDVWEREIHISFDRISHNKVILERWPKIIRRLPYKIPFSRRNRLKEKSIINNVLNNIEYKVSFLINNYLSQEQLKNEITRFFQELLPIINSSLFPDYSSESIYKRNKTKLLIEQILENIGE